MLHFVGKFIEESSLVVFEHVCDDCWTDQSSCRPCGGLAFVRWGCREHFVSGCWHSSGRDRGRYPRECWLSTLGVLHPGVPVMWYGHIRDLSPSAEGCKGGRMPNVTRLHWAQPLWQSLACVHWCKAVMCVVCWYVCVCVQLCLCLSVCFFVCACVFHAAPWPQLGETTAKESGIVASVQLWIF